GRRPDGRPPAAPGPVVDRSRRGAPGRRVGPGRAAGLGAPVRPSPAEDPERMTITRLTPDSSLCSCPPPEKWDVWREYDVKQWPRRVEKRYQLVPTICFNCEAACGLLAWIDKDTMQVRKFEGNPLHPASRGRNCAKGPATINQIRDPERILYPQLRGGKRGEGRWLRASWKEVLEDLGGRIREAFAHAPRNHAI